MSALISSASTRATISSVASSVYRRPWTNRGSSPACSIATRDRLAAAVDDDRPHADRLHEDDVDQQGPERLGIFHHRAAELDDREPAVELADVAQRLDQDIRLADRFLMHFDSPSSRRAQSRPSHHCFNRAGTL